MAELRVVWRMARWWQCAIMIAVTAFFGWVIRSGLRSTNPHLWPHVLIPPYMLLAYATLSSLLNRRSVVVTPEHLIMTNGPVAVGVHERIPRDDVSFAWFSPVTTVDDGGDEITLWYVTGIETHAGRHVQLFGMFNSGDAARAAARGVADAFSSVNGFTMPVREVGSVHDDPVEQRRIHVWGGIIATAFALGLAWDLALRWGR
jgi:hypothetical protein